MKGVSSIGIQVITPKTGTRPDQYPAQQNNARDAAEEETPKKAPPPPGMGTLVDKVV